MHIKSNQIEILFKVKAVHFSLNIKQYSLSLSFIRIYENIFNFLLNLLVNAVAQKLVPI